jgi:RNA polymerase primary sigma factor
MNGRVYAWDAVEGLDPAVALEVEGFIRKKAWGYSSWARMSGLEPEDLVQEGWAGALKAAAKFNPEAGAKYLTYAAWWIDAAMKEAMNHRFIRTPEGESHAWVSSLDAPLGGEGEHEGPTFLDWQCADQPSAQDLATAAEDRARVQAALAKLKASDREVLVRHLGLNGRQPQPLQVVAKGLGVTRQRAVQILERATQELRLGLAG